MTNKYIQQVQGAKRDDGKRAPRSSAPHMISQANPTLSRCGKVQAGKNGYTIIEKENPYVHAALCQNCLMPSRHTGGAIGG